MIQEAGVKLDSADYLKSWLKISPDAATPGLSKALDPERFVKAYWNDSTRPDGRMFPQARSTKVVSSLLKHSAGSALIQQGNTKILCAMTVQIGQPAPQLPDHGDVVVSVTTPDQVSHLDVLQSWLQRMLDDLLPPQLALIKGKAGIRLVVTVMILQDDGNLRDAALTACMAAWKDTTLPTMDNLTEHQGKLSWTESPITSIDTTKTNSSEQKGSSSYRVSLTMGVIENKNNVTFLVDPSMDESMYTNGILTIVVTMPSKSLQVEYSGSAALSAVDLALASRMAHGRVDELSAILQ